MLNKYGELYEDISLENYNTYGIDVKSKYLIKVTNIDMLQELIKYLKKIDMPYLVLGKGSNVILPDTKFQGVIISLEKLNHVQIKENIVISECGISLSELVYKTIENNLGGLYYLGTIPGSLGGALYGNAGCFNHDIYEYLESVLVIRDGQLVTLRKEDIQIKYRETSFQNTQDILVEATFKLPKEDKDVMLNELKENRLKRQQNQPLKYKNAGSVFKNPPSLSAGKLIDDLNLKGYRINDAMVSYEHANFIVNVGHAKSADIKKLIAIIQEKVYNTYKIRLELEQKIIEWD